jgi:hypothetical protein
MDSSAYALQAVKGIKFSFDNAVKHKLQEYMEQGVIKFYQTSEITEIYTSTEGLGGSKELAELETPPSLVLSDGYSVSVSEKRFGGAIVVSEKTYRRDGADNTLKVDQFLERQRNQLMIDNTNLLLTRAFTMLNEAFLSTSDFLAPDGVELCGTHSWASGNTFDNGVTDALDSQAVDDAWDYAGRFTDPSGKPMPLNWTTIVVKKGSANEREAIRLFAKGITPTAVSDINIYEGTMRIISTPYITYANRNYWFMMDNSTYDSPLAVGIGEYPTLRDPIKESNEAIRSNCTGFWKQGVINMPFQIYGSTGAI